MSADPLAFYYPRHYPFPSGHTPWYAPQISTASQVKAAMAEQDYRRALQQTDPRIFSMFPSEYHLFGLGEGGRPVASTTQVTNQIARHQIPTLRKKHYYHRHHGHGYDQGKGVKSKARYSATGSTHDSMLIRDTKMSLSSAPTSPNAGSVGGSLGINYSLPHPVTIANSAYLTPQCKDSKSSLSSGYSSKSSKNGYSSISSLSSCSSLSSSTSMNGISPRKRRADEPNCRKDVINLCSCETCATDDVTARVDDVTLRDGTNELPVQQQKRSKNDDDVVFLSAEAATVTPSTRTPQTSECVNPDSNEHAIRKKNRKAKRVVPVSSPNNANNNFPFVTPEQIERNPAQIMNRYYLRSSAKARKAAVPVGTGVSPSYSTLESASAHSDAGYPRYHTRSHQKKARPEVVYEVPQQVNQPQSATVAQPPVAVVAPSSSTSQPASVIQSAPANRSAPQQTPPTSSRPATTPARYSDEATRNSSFKKTYEAHGIIGVGGGGTVYSGIRKADGLQVAIKQVPKAKVKRWGKLNDRVVPIEFELLYRASRTGHRGIIGMLDWYERRSTYILVMERPQPVIDLFDYLNQYGALPEVNARVIFRQIAEAVLHCHANGVIHRDIKDENVILNLHTSEAKLIDFGCGTMAKEAHFTEFAGTPEFYPPEWFTDRRYLGHRVDAWSLGVLLYTMVEAEVPFQKEKDIVECNLRHKRGDQLSDALKHLISWLLQKDQDKRPRSILDILAHPWLQFNFAPHSGVMGTDELYEKRLHHHQNGSSANTVSSGHHRVASKESPQSPPR